MHKTHRPAIRGREYAVASVHYLATMAGQQILAQGGNAADAGVATGLCINVLEPELAHFGGVAPIIYCPGDGGPVETISGLGRWPRAASRAYFQQEHDGDLPEGVLRAIIPAAADAWLTALSRYGTMSFAQVVAPALALAEHGRPVDERFHAAMRDPEHIAWPTTRAVFHRDGHIPSVGELFRQPELAACFRLMMAAEAAAGKDRAAGITAARDAYYRGEIAQRMVAFHQTQGGFLTMADLAEFRVGIEAPAMLHYKGYDVYSCGAWCQGPAMLMLLQMLAPLDLVGMGHNSATYLHTLLEATKLAFADREAYFGDPEFVDVPLDILLDPGYAAARLGAIDPEQAVVGLPPAGDLTPWRPTATAPSKRQSQPGLVNKAEWHSDTSYLCVVDAAGNTFSATPSDGLGSSPVVPGNGFPVSSRGYQSWLDDDHPSRLEPWKRPRLTPNPALVLKDGKPVMALGCPGGDAQVQAMLQVFLNMVEFGMDPQAAIEAPRIISHSFPNSFWPHHSRPGEATVESRIPADVRDELASKGHRLMLDGAWSGKVARVCTIRIESESGVRTAGADPRSTSYAAAW